MNAIAVFAVNEHIEYLLDEAAARRAMPKGPSLRARLSAFIDSLWTAVTAPAASRPQISLNRG